MILNDSIENGKDILKFESKINLTTILTVWLTLAVESINCTHVTLSLILLISSKLPLIFHCKILQHRHCSTSFIYLSIKIALGNFILSVHPCDWYENRDPIRLTLTPAATNSPETMKAEEKLLKEQIFEFKKNSNVGASGWNSNSLFSFVLQTGI